jgi:hypothetical protein
MTKILALLTAIIAVTGCQSSHNAPRDPSADIKPWLTYLASDELEGRGLKTEGINQAADFIAQHFEDMGLGKLPSLGDYFQDFQVTVDVKNSPDTSFSLGDASFKFDDDFVPLAFSGEGKFEGPVAFIGYSIVNPEAKYDDFAGIDLKGKVALALRYDPHDDKGQSRFSSHGPSPFAALTEKAKQAADHGASALLIVNPPNFHEERLTSLARRGGEKSAIPIIMISQKLANEMLARASAPDLKTLQEKLDTSAAPASQDLKGVTVSGNVQFERTRKTARNVVALLPGTGARKDEFIVVGAHYDHLGRGETGAIGPNRNEIHNGADDNASGTTAMLKAASLLAREQKRDRSILFIAFTGEEQGLLGSEHFVKNCPVPVEKIAYMVNLDMVGRVQKDTLLVGGSGTAEGFDAILQKADARSPLALKTAGGDVGAKGGIGPSDHASFAKAKIPVIFFFSGTHKDYHRPTDDADKINFAGMEDAIDVTIDVVHQLDRLPRQAYVDKFDRSMSGGGRSRVQLGVMPSYTESETPGVTIDGTMPDTPAAKAGLLQGDVIVQIGQDKLTSVSDLSDVLVKHKPGDSVKVIYIRTGETKETDVTLAERKQ